ncbi:MAG TPA: hypothetical protein VFF32_00040 [Dermatophilaceae bacterium]|nr:hypothetical protein [Dermatophilaceae bacterium]
MSNQGSAIRGPHNLGRQRFEYRSEHTLAKWPFVHISVGGRGDDGRYRLGEARGIIAVGDVAVGLVAIGGVAIGLVSFGGIAIGLVALGGIALGLTATGAIAIGLTAVGAIAIGVTTHGPVTVGTALGARIISKSSSP